jgi:hypothetical protein
MLATTTPSPKSQTTTMGSVSRTGFSARTVNRVERADFSRDARLLDASVAGVVLSFNPRDEEMRKKAARTWTAIRTVLADHLFTEEESAQPWNADASVGSATARQILTKRYLELRSLARTINSVSFDDDLDVRISDAGKALCRLAVKLDDLMEETDRRQINKLREYVFGSGEGLGLSA